MPAYGSRSGRRDPAVERSSARLRNRIASRAPLELRRERRGGADEVTVGRRRELEPPRVEEQPVESVRAPADVRSRTRVARHRVTDRVEVHADLVRSPGDQVELEEVQPSNRSRTR